MYKLNDLLFIYLSSESNGSFLALKKKQDTPWIILIQKTTMIFNLVIKSHPDERLIPVVSSHSTEDLLVSLVIGVPVGDDSNQKDPVPFCKQLRCIGGSQPKNMILMEFQL